MAELNLRGSMHSAIKRCAVRANDGTFLLDILAVQQERRKLEAYYAKFISNHEILVAKATTAELEQHERLFMQVEQLYDEACIALDRAVQGAPGVTSEVKSLQVSSWEAQGSELKLDPLAIPTFDGALHNWLAFKDTFETLVHNPKFPEAYKLAKLRQAVNAEQVPLVGGMYSGGYEEVWAALKARYDRPNLLAEIHVSRFINMAASTHETSSTLLHVVDTVRESLRALRVMKIPVESWDALAVPIILPKLPFPTQQAWGMSLITSDIPKLEELLCFLERRAHSLNTSKLCNSSQRDSVRRDSAGMRPVRSHLATADDGKCHYCKYLHRLTRCPQLLALTAAQRFEWVRSSKLCFNCLQPGHTALKCASGNCRNCGHKHNTLLCRGRIESVAPQPDAPLVSTSGLSGPALGSHVAMIAHLNYGSNVVLLATAQARIAGAHQEIAARILCDPGSQVSFISESLAVRLRLHRERCSMTVEGIGCTTPLQAKGIARLELKSIYGDFSFALIVVVLPSIASPLPPVEVNVAQWPHLRNLKLADPCFGVPGPVDILIGAEAWGHIVEGGLIRRRSDEPYAQRTKLGWVVFGPANPTTGSQNLMQSLHAHVNNVEDRLDEIVQRFWQGEEVPSSTVIDSECEDYFMHNHHRTPDGRYVVKLLFHRNPDCLGDSYQVALRQFYQLERRLMKNPDVHQQYIAFMREYEQLGHMVRVEEPNEKEQSYYIPHHAVMSKFRVVFNASTKTSSGVSLNEIQMVGPTIQSPLINTLFRFRQYQFALTADVEKMFRQIMVAQDHQKWQRILWREAPHKPLSTYELTTVTYGMTCSPYNAVRTLNQCAADNIDLVDPERAASTKQVILSSFYVDDLLISCSTRSEAVQLATDVQTVLGAGCFKLRKWNSNDRDILLAVNPMEPSQTELAINVDVTTVLGLRWDPVFDEFIFDVTPLSDETYPTKRRVLSEVARLFDPTGLLAPVIITGKIFIQSLWAAGLSWDAPLPDDLRNIWCTFRNGLKKLHNLRIPRWLGIVSDNMPTLYGFCDASTKAYGAVVYAKTTDSYGNSRIGLITARTRVSPLKGATIPRLELCAAELLALTLANVQKALHLLDGPCLLFSDSRIVLCWIRKPLGSLKQYVANRVSHIQRLTPIDSWYHISSEQNPADCASRGLSVPELLAHRLWWNGPDCIHHDQIFSGHSNVVLSEDELEELQREAKVTALVSHALPRLTITIRTSAGAVIPILERFSSMQSLLRTVAIVLRWNPRRRSYWRQSVIMAVEINDAHNMLVRMVQCSFFAAELQCLKMGKPLPSRTSLLPLDPFLDPEGVIRVGGRLSKSALQYGQQHPVILPRQDPLTQLIVKRTHQETLHGGTQLMLQTLRQRYWILQARQAVRSFIHRCPTCRRHRGATLTQQMASLPKQRVCISRPFLAAGIDYCGPFNLRVGGVRSRTTVKTYVAIFVCMATKAVHIEVVEDLSARAFLDAFARFVSRRGRCKELFSDNATTFHRADRLLKEDLAQWTSQRNQQELADNGTTWHFISPRSPHQGGLWEAAIKSAKRHLTKIVGAQILRFTEMQTLTVRVEACLNSRPLVALHDGPDDRLVLTPGDFLIGEPLLAVPEALLEDVPTPRLKRWQWLRRLHQEFWHRWSHEYLTTLQRRGKWQRRSEDIRIGDVVAIKEDNQAPTQWRLGRVIAVHPGKDGLIRNATMRTMTGNSTRAVQKLCRLLGENDFEPDSSTGQDVRDLFTTPNAPA